VSSVSLKDFALPGGVLAGVAVLVFALSVVVLAVVPAALRVHGDVLVAGLFDQLFGLAWASYSVCVTNSCARSGQPGIWVRHLLAIVFLPFLASLRFQRRRSDDENLAAIWCKGHASLCAFLTSSKV